jgi:hypothetical protein
MMTTVEKNKRPSCKRLDEVGKGVKREESWMILQLMLLSTNWKMVPATKTRNPEGGPILRERRIKCAFKTPTCNVAQTVGFKLMGRKKNPTTLLFIVYFGVPKYHIAT